jgi:hypothetical protein
MVSDENMNFADDPGNEIRAHVSALQLLNNPGSVDRRFRVTVREGFMGSITINATYLGKTQGRDEYCFLSRDHPDNLLPCYCATQIVQVALAD